MKFVSIGAALVALAALATPAAAQRVVTNPGYCAQFYPNDDCNSEGPPTPAAKTVEPSDPTPAAAPAPAPAVHKQKHRAKAATAAPAKQQ